MASSAFIVLVMKNLCDVYQAPYMTLDKKCDLCLSGTMIPGTGSNYDLYFLYLLEAMNVSLFEYSTIQTELYMADKIFDPWIDLS